MNVYEYFEGQCSICGYKGVVRHKNIWLIGSEGTDMCWSCEKAMLDFLNERKAEFIKKRIIRIKERKENGKSKGVT